MFVANIYAMWDQEAEVWVGWSDEEIGVATEAASLDELNRKLPELVKEGLEANGVNVRQFVVHLHTTESEDACA